ncbi:DUF6265 family protein [Aquimarina sp. 2201CG5-10]|uniref:DUF6265 family protein n=1 Tax=Aquimarina callyspongiae TaxID=3098150 RepID=UPI002AB508A9|nr:DUF6265 family protein [Aquimarina sp. 2201CG5-10]MDY8135966.1 DUF6265 family protein [Aquimarina sp. 2201CG5-10]
MYTYLTEKIKNLKLLILIILPFFVYGQNQFENTLKYNDSTGSPKADLKVIEWLSGYWKGEAFGGITEEVWTPPIGNSMMCAFKLIVNNEIQFYELLTITEEDETLILRLKHFNDDLTGWEEKDKTYDFKLVKVTENKVFFNGFTFEKVSDQEINVYVVFEKNNKKTETKFNYKRIKL